MKPPKQDYLHKSSIVLKSSPSAALTFTLNQVSTPNNPVRFLSVDDDDMIHALLPGMLRKYGPTECLDSDNMDVVTVVGEIRKVLAAVDILILDGNYNDTNGTNDQTALQVIQSLTPELSAKSITVIVYSASPEILDTVKEAYPCVSIIGKELNLMDIFGKFKAAVEARAPFQVN